MTFLNVLFDTPSVCLSHSKSKKTGNVISSNFFSLIKRGTIITNILLIWFLTILRLRIRNTGTLVHWYTGTLVHWYTGTLVHWYTDTLVHWYTGTLVHWYTGTLVHSYTILVHYQSTSVPVYQIIVKKINKTEDCSPFM